MAKLFPHRKILQRMCICRHFTVEGIPIAVNYNDAHTPISLNIFMGNSGVTYKNEVKKLFMKMCDETMVSQHGRHVDTMPPMGVISTFYLPTHNMDIDNLMLVNKFFVDMLCLDEKYQRNDNVNYFKFSATHFGGISKDNPRCDVTIYSLMKSHDSEELSMKKEDMLADTLIICDGFEVVTTNKSVSSENHNGSFVIDGQLSFVNNFRYEAFIEAISAACKVAGNPVNVDITPINKRGF